MSEPQEPKPKKKPERRQKKRPYEITIPLGDAEPR